MDLWDDDKLITVLHGPNEFLIHEAVVGFRSGVLPEELRDVNTLILDGSVVDMDEIVNSVFTPPFMSNSRLVLVEGLLGKFDSRVKKSPARSTNLSNWADFVSRITRIPDTTILVFKEGDLSSGNTLLNKLSAVADVRRFPNMGRTEVIGWIEERARNMGLKIEHTAKKLLAEYVGSELRVLNSELGKLALYKGTDTVKRKDIMNIVADVREESIFMAVDAAVQGRVGRSLKLVRSLINSGYTPAIVIRMIERQVRLLILAKHLRVSGIPRSTWPKKLSLSGYPLKKTLAQEVSFSHSELEEFHDRILAYDLRVRTGGLSEEMGLDMLLLESGMK